MKKIEDFKIEKRISIGMMIFLAVSLLPIILLAFYNYPCADDFSASDSVRLAWVNTGSLLEVIKAAWENVMFNYREWSGVFMSVFWTSLQFGIFGEQFYGVTTVIAVILLVLGGFYLSHVICEKYLSANSSMSKMIAVLYVFTSIQCMPDGNEGLYWHAGVVNYTWAFAFLLLLLGSVLSAFKEEKQNRKNLKCVLSCILAVFVGGGNYLTALQGSIWFIFLTGLCCMLTFKKEKSAGVQMLKKNLVVILPLVVLMVSFVVSVTAPGNKVRMASANGMGIVEAVMTSFVYGFHVPANEWLSWRVAALLLMAVPVMWHIAGGSRFLFAYPGVVALLGYCMVSAGFTPNLYAQGNVGGGRLADTIYFIWFFWVYVVLFYLVGWARNLLGKTQVKQEGLSKRSRICVGVVFAVWFAGSYLQLFISDGIYVGTQAAGSIMSGQAAGYKQENEERLELLYSEDIVNVEFPIFSNPPELLLFQDITYSADDWLNQVMAEYYGKESVKIVP